MHAFVEPHFFETLPRIFFRMPRVVLNQRAKFENDELFKKLSRECEVRYTGYKDKSPEERQHRFFDALRQGYIEIVFVGTGTNFQLFWDPMTQVNNLNNYHTLDPSYDGFDLISEPGKVLIRSRFIMNGVCIRWRGWLNIKSFEGVGCLEFDEESAKLEDALLKQQLKCAVY